MRALGLYDRLSRFNRLNYRGKIMVVAFLGTHIPLLAIIAFMAPTLLLVWWGFSDAQWFTVAGIAGIATGVGMLVLGIAAGGRAFRRRAPQLLDLMLRT